MRLTAVISWRLLRRSTPFEVGRLILVVTNPPNSVAAICFQRLAPSASTLSSLYGIPLSELNATVRKQAIEFSKDRSRPISWNEETGFEIEFTETKP